jgi:hypothetical protein
VAQVALAAPSSPASRGGSLSPFPSADARRSYGLLRVRDGGEVNQVRRRGRFSVPREIAVPKHLLHRIEQWPAPFVSLVKEAQDEFVKGIRTQGYEYVDHGFDIRYEGPSYQYSGDASPDPGPQHLPNRRPDQAPELWAHWEREEKKKRGKTIDQKQFDMVDYVLVATFRRKGQSRIRAVAASVLDSPTRLAAAVTGRR